jgi:hypothetical protein
MLSMLGHDFGKPATSRKVELVDGTTQITAYGHEAAGVKPFKDFLNSMGAPNRDIEGGSPLVKDHLIHANFASENPPKNQTVAKLANRLKPASISDLCLIMQSDLNGRPPLPKTPGKGIEILREQAVSIGCLHGPVRPLLQGKDLLDVGMGTGPQMGSTLRGYLKRQIDGEFSTREDALEALREDFAVEDLDPEESALIPPESERITSEPAL